MPITSRAAACGDTPQKMGKNRPRGRRPKVPRSQTPPFVYQPGMKIAEGKDIETPCAKAANRLGEDGLAAFLLIAHGGGLASGQPVAPGAKPARIKGRGQP